MDTQAIVQQVTAERDRLNRILAELAPAPVKRRGRPAAASTPIIAKWVVEEIKAPATAKRTAGRPKGRSNKGTKSQADKMKKMWAKWRAEAKRTGVSVAEVRAASKAATA